MIRLRVKVRPIRTVDTVLMSRELERADGSIAKTPSKMKSHRGVHSNL